MRVSPLHLKILAYTLHVEGFDSRPLLEHCSVASIDELQEDGEWVPVSQFDRMMAAAIETTRDPAFGLVAGKSLALMRYGHAVPLALAAPSLRQILEDLRHFARLVLENSEIDFAETPQTARLVVKPVVQGGLSRHFRMEMLATSSLQLLRFTGANESDIYGIDLPYACPAGQEERYATAFGPCVNFERSECAIHFNPALLDTPLRTHDPVSYVSARTRAESALAAKLAQSNMAERVRQRLLSAFPQQPTTADTAAYLKISERSLRRHLSILGVTHADLAQECQRLMAEHLLADGKVSLKSIADQLGFSSVSSFHRAFRRWTGLTPSDWRDSRSARG